MGGWEKGIPEEKREGKRVVVGREREIHTMQVRTAYSRVEGGPCALEPFLVSEANA